MITVKYPDIIDTSLLKPIDRHPNEYEIFQYIKQVLIKLRINGKISTAQYRTIKSYAKRNDKINERNLRKWFLKNFPKEWESIEKYTNTTLHLLECSIKFTSPVPANYVMIEI